MEALGRTMLGTAWGFSGFIYGISATVGPIFAGLIADKTGSFALSYEFGGLCMFLSMLPMAWLYSFRTRKAYNLQSP